MQTPTAPPTAVGMDRRRATLWALVVALAAPLVVAPVMGLGLPSRPLGALAASMLGHVAAVVAGAMATVRWPLRVAVAATAVLGAAGGLNWLLARGTGSFPVVVAAVLGSIVGPLLLPALARLGQAQARGIHPQLDRAWEVSARLTLAVGVTLALLHLGALLTYGGLYSSLGGVPAALALTLVLSGVAGVAGWHAAVCAVRSDRALTGRTPGPARPWLLGVLLAAGAVLGLVAAIGTAR